ncbi:MAG: DUF933 domain-containing protein [bacterium]|nr:DUF933 domain-containing protein [bacterium]
MNIGLIGKSRSGKTTTFHLLTGTAPDPHAAHKHEVQMGVTHVPDPRVDTLAEISASKKKIYVTVEYVDAPAFDVGAAKSDWFASALEGGVKNSEALLLVARAFGADELSEPLDPLRDVLAVQDELVLSDMLILEKRMDRLTRQRKVKTLSADEQMEMGILERASETLANGKPLRTLALDTSEKKTLRGFQFLSEKPLLAVVNAAEDDLTRWGGEIRELNGKLEPHGIRAVALSAALEGEIARLDPAERAVFMSDLGVTELARDRILRASFDLLGLMSFLTTGDKESRAWPLRKGETALDAAASIHTDLARGFIRAEVVAYDDFVREGGYPGCKTKGLLRLEGKDYPVKDGDILVIRHSS